MTEIKTWQEHIIEAIGPEVIGDEKNPDLSTFKKRLYDEVMFEYTNYDAILGLIAIQAELNQYSPTLVLILVHTLDAEYAKASLGREMADLSQGEFDEYLRRTVVYMYRKYEQQIEKTGMELREVAAAILTGFSAFEPDVYDPAYQGLVIDILKEEGLIE